MTDILDIRQLSILHAGPQGQRTLLSDVELTVGEAETVGIVGESGSGKSLTAKAVMQLLPQQFSVRGEIRYRGENFVAAGERRMTALRGSEISLLMQDPFTMLDPLLSCGAQVAEGLKLGMPGATRREVQDGTLRRLAEVGIRDPDVALRYPFQMSGGMRQRAAMAAALARNPQLLIADEPSTALDVTTQAEILALLKSLQEARGMALLLITHDLRVAFSVCARVNVFYAGRVLESAPAAALRSRPLHPYALGLLMSEPAIDRRAALLAAIPGTVPTPDAVAESCAFAPRCHWCQAACTSARPPLAGVGARRQTACLRIADIADDMATHRTLVDQAEEIATCSSPTTLPWCDRWSNVSTSCTAPKS